MGDKSQYNQLAKQYQEQGMSEEEAKRKAFLQIYAINPALSGAAGFVSGFTMGTGANLRFTTRYTQVTIQDALNIR